MYESDSKSGYGAVSRSVCFWASWIRIRNFFYPAPGSFQQQANKWRKTMISTVLRHLYDFLSLKNDCKCIFKMNKHKTWRKNIFCWRLEGHWRKEHEPVRIRGSGSLPKCHGWMRNTDFNSCGLPVLVLVVNGLLAVAKDLAAWFARVGSFFPAKRNIKKAS